MDIEVTFVCICSNGNPAASFGAFFLQIESGREAGDDCGDGNLFGINICRWIYDWKMESGTKVLVGNARWSSLFYVTIDRLFRYISFVEKRWGKCGYCDVFVSWRGIAWRNAGVNGKP